MAEPFYYWPGPKRENYSISLLFFELFKALIVAFLFVVIPFFCMDGMSINADGKNGSFWFDGTVMYGVVCTYANLWLI